MSTVRAGEAVVDQPQPRPTAQTPAFPGHIRVRQGRPTRVWIDGGRHRFGIAQARRAEGRVRVTVLSDGGKEGFDLRAGDTVGMAGHRWRADTVDLSEEGRCLVVLEHIDDGQVA